MRIITGMQKKRVTVNFERSRFTLHGTSFNQAKPFFIEIDSGFKIYQNELAQQGNMNFYTVPSYKGENVVAFSNVEVAGLFEAIIDECYSDYPSVSFELNELEKGIAYEILTDKPLHIPGHGKSAAHNIEWNQFLMEKN